MCVRNRAAYFARLLRGTVKGLGTRDNDLIRLLVSRAEWDLAQVKVSNGKDGYTVY
jgi:hypothetical protein